MRQVQKAGCRAPYQKPYQNFPFCNTQKGMKRAITNWKKLQISYLPVPCQEIPDVPFKHTQIVNKKTHGFRIKVYYPKKVKIIKQSRSVDVHSLIGNIGGYIGLFLGKYYINVLTTCRVTLNAIIF